MFFSFSFFFFIIVIVIVVVVPSFPLFYSRPCGCAFVRHIILTSWLIETVSSFPRIEFNLNNVVSAQVLTPTEPWLTPISLLWRFFDRTLKTKDDTSVLDRKNKFLPNTIFSSSVGNHRLDPSFQSAHLVPPHFVDEDRSIQQPTVIEGSALQLSCSADGRPKPSITWFSRTSDGKLFARKSTVEITCPLHRTVVVEQKEKMRVMIWHVNVIGLDMPSRISRVQDDWSFLFFIIPLRNRDDERRFETEKSKCMYTYVFPSPTHFLDPIQISCVCMCFHFFHLTVEHWLERQNRNNHNTDRLCQQVQSNIVL